MKYLALLVLFSISSSTLAADCKSILSGLWRTTTPNAKTSHLLDVVVRYKIDGEFGALISEKKAGSNPILATGKWACKDGTLVTYAHAMNDVKISPSDPGMTTRYRITNYSNGSFTAIAAGDKRPQVYVRMSGTLGEYYRKTYGRPLTTQSR